jgi:hypothetical protein
MTPAERHRAPLRILLWTATGTVFVTAVLLVVTFVLAAVIMNVSFLESVRSGTGILFGVLFGLLVGAVALLAARPIPPLERGAEKGIVLVALGHTALRAWQMIERGVYVSLENLHRGGDEINLLGALMTPIGLLSSLAVYRLLTRRTDTPEGAGRPDV